MNSSSPAHTFVQPGTFTVRCTASNNVSRVTGTATLNVVDAITGVVLAYDGPTTLGRDTFIKVVVRVVVLIRSIKSKTYLARRMSHANLSCFVAMTTQCDALCKLHAVKKVLI